MKRLSIVFLFILLSFKVFSQEKYSFHNNFVLYFTPSTLLDYHSRVRIGGVYIFKNNWALDLGLGAGSNSIQTLHTERGYYFLYEVRPEIKFLSPYSENGYQYFSVELFYINMDKTILSSSYEKRGEEHLTKYSRAHLYKQKYGVHFKWGVSTTLWEDFFFDLYVGFGYAQREVVYRDVVNPQEEDGLEPHFLSSFFYPNQEHEGIIRMLHIALGFKIGYVFSNR